MKKPYDSIFCPNIKNYKNYSSLSACEEREIRFYILCSTTYPFTIYEDYSIFYLNLYSIVFSETFKQDLKYNREYYHHMWRTHAV